MPMHKLNLGDYEVVTGEDELDMRPYLESMERENPELWRLCYPRIYTEPKCGRYYSPKNVAHSLLQNAMKINAGLVGTSELYEFFVASELVKHRVPMFWLSQDMALAVGKTVPPGKIPWYTMPLPFSAAVLMLPKGTLVHPTEGDVEFVAYGRFKKNHNQISKLNGKPYESENGGMTFLARTRKHLLHWNLPLDACGDSFSLPDIEQYATQIKASEQHTSLLALGPLNMSNDDNRLMVGVAHYVFGSLLLMESRPDLLTRGSLRKRVSKNGEVREFWTPNILGEHYQIRREHQGGTHASPRFHWVRGAYKQQAYGPRLELRKQIWVEPYTRGLE